VTTENAGPVPFRQAAWGTAALADRLRKLVGPTHVLVDADLIAPYETDWTGRFIGMAACVVRPGSTDEVAAVVRACHDAGLPMTVQGGNTGLVGGAAPASGSVLISLTRLIGREPVDVIEAQVTVGAGLTLEALQRHASAAGLHFGVDLAARSAATVGGLVATNAGGVNVLRFGSMRQQVTGLEAVLADGTVISRLGGLAKDNTGYDLPQLLIGSEGTLAIITRVRVRLVPQLPARAVALVALPGTGAALELVAAARALPGLTAAELFYPAGLELVREYAQLSAPFTAPAGAYLLLECAGPVDDLLGLLEASETLLLEISGMFWSLLAACLGLEAGGVSGQGTLYFAVSGLILASSIVESSYSLAYRDELTSLHSRRAFNDAISGMKHPYAVAAVDIDHFKSINDTYGHDTGDQVLRLVASRLASVTGGGNAYRVGGEEFTILFPGRNSEEVFQHLELLRMNIESCSFRLRRGEDRRKNPREGERRVAGRGQTTKRANSGALSVTVSIGIAESRPRAAIERVIELADKALYNAKQSGRNRIEVASRERKGRTTQNSTPTS